MARERATQGWKMLSWRMRALLLLLLGCAAWATMATSRKPTPELLRVTVFSWGLCTSRETADLAAGQLIGIGFLGRDGEGISKYAISVPKEEFASLSKAIRDISLCDSPPKPEWFTSYRPGKRVCRDGSTTLVFHWSDRELALAVPPDDVLPRLPKVAQAYYRKIDAILNGMHALRTKHVQQSKLVKVTGSNSAEMVQLHREMEQAHLMSVPQRRKDWDW